MTKARYSTEILIKNGRIRSSIPVGFENASTEQRTAINLIKPIMNTWLRSKVSSKRNAEILVKTKYLETTNGLTIEFKIQQIVPIE